MRAAVFQGIGNGHKIETVPDPVPIDGEVVIRVERSGICATDITITSRRNEPSPLDAMYDPLSRPGTVLGHEIAGEVVALGPRVEYLKVGDRVAPTAFSGCGTCLSCLSGKADWCAGVGAKMGGYGEYAVANEWNCVRLPKTFSIDDAALIEPMATSLHAVTLAKINPGSRVVVIGAGPIGLGMIYFARRSGARFVVAIARSNRHRELALQMGADAFLTQGPDMDHELLELFNGMPDIVFEASGAFGVINQAMNWVRPAGKVVVASVNLLPDKVMHAIAVMKEVCLQYAASYVTGDFHILADMFANGDTPLRKLITKRISLDEFPAAFEEVRNKNIDCKVMLAPGG
jgi:(R,R)-butanediol dehydrogenase/meso-butanediol dehydrogenase/diacetyl reductase